jgi:hypothetical protein
LLTGKRLQAQKGFADVRTQVGHGPAQLDDTAGVSAIAGHLVNASGAQPGMLI